MLFGFVHVVRWCKLCLLFFEVVLGLDWAFALLFVVFVVIFCLVSFVFSCLVEYLPSKSVSGVSTLDASSCLSSSELTER